MLSLSIRSSGFAFVISSVLYLGCSSNEPEPVDCSLSELAIDAAGQDPTSCNANDGSITATATGGTEPYKFTINTGSFGTASEFTNLGGGNYTVKVRDKNDCENSIEVLLVIPGADPLHATSISTDDTECLTNNGIIEVTAGGGAPPYEYRIGTGAFSGVSIFNNLAPGNYSVAIKDNTGCIFTKSAVVNKGDSQTSLSVDVEPIIQSKCAITNCHNGSESPNLTTASAIIANATSIKSVTQSGQMLKAGSSAGPLSDAQKALIACWVDEGAKNN